MELIAPCLAWVPIRPGHFDHLGFRSASHFSRFFKQRAGFTPAAYRRAARDAAARRQPLPSSTYADWP